MDTAPAAPAATKSQPRLPTSVPSPVPASDSADLHASPSPRSRLARFISSRVITTFGSARYPPPAPQSAWQPALPALVLRMLAASAGGPTNYRQKREDETNPELTTALLALVLLGRYKRAVPHAVAYGADAERLWGAAYVVSAKLAGLRLGLCTGMGGTQVAAQEHNLCSWARIAHLSPALSAPGALAGVERALCAALAWDVLPDPAEYARVQAAYESWVYEGHGAEEIDPNAAWHGGYEDTIERVDGCSLALALPEDDRASLTHPPAYAAPPPPPYTAASNDILVAAGPAPLDGSPSPFPLFSFDGEDEDENEDELATSHRHRDRNASCAAQHPNSTQNSHNSAPNFHRPRARPSHARTERGVPTRTHLVTPSDLEDRMGVLRLLTASPSPPPRGCLPRARNAGTSNITNTSASRDTRGTRPSSSSTSTSNIHALARRISTNHAAHARRRGASGPARLASPTMAGRRSRSRGATAGNGAGTCNGTVGTAPPSSPAVAAPAARSALARVRARVRTLVAPTP